MLNVARPRSETPGLCGRAAQSRGGGDCAPLLPAGSTEAGKTGAGRTPAAALAWGHSSLAEGVAGTEPQPLEPVPAFCLCPAQREAPESEDLYQCSGLGSACEQSAPALHRHTCQQEHPSLPSLFAAHSPGAAVELPALCSQSQECPKVGMVSRGPLWEAASTEHSLQ